MKTIKTTAIAALLSCSLLTPAPAMAQTIDPVARMQQTCAATNVVNPDENSTYSAALGDYASIVSAERVLSRVTTLHIPGGVLLSKTPALFMTGSEGRNAGSPNIFGEFKSTATYSGGSLVQQVVYGKDTIYTFGCVVSKTNSQGKITTPPGLQVTGLSLTVTTQTRSVEERAVAPDVTQDYFSSGVICNSPLKNPGVWRAQNGYTGTCSTAAFLALGSALVHTNSVPYLPPINAEADRDESRHDDISLPATVIDNDHEVIATAS